MALDEGPECWPIARNRLVQGNTLLVELGLGWVDESSTTPVTSGLAKLEKRVADRGQDDIVLATPQPPITLVLAAPRIGRRLRHADAPKSEKGESNRPKRSTASAPTYIGAKTTTI